MTFNLLEWIFCMPFLREATWYLTLDLKERKNNCQFYVKVGRGGGGGGREGEIVPLHTTEISIKIKMIYILYLNGWQSLVKLMIICQLSLQFF